MRGHFRPLIAAGALLGLIVLLATLQYRWLGQISGAERDRMKTTLNTRANAFAEDVDRELTRAYLLFQLDAMQAEPASAGGIVARHDRWQATARFPRMIKDVYLVPPPEASGTPARLQHYNASARLLEPVQWPEALNDIRKQLSQAGPASGQGETRLLRPLPAVVWPSIPALVVAAPVVMVSHLDAGAARELPARLTPAVRHAVVVLDAAYMENEMLPALAQQHFRGTDDGFDYQLAVVPVAPGEHPLYHSVADFTPTPATAADASVDLFAVRVRDFESIAAEVSRFFTFIAVPGSTGEQRTRAIVRETLRTPGSVDPGQGPISVIVRSGSAATQGMDKLVAGATTATFASRVSAATPAQWRLLVKHPSGSLERAVNAARRRNLIVSTSILGVLGVSVGFLVLSTRRAQELARQQLEFVATVSHELRTPLAVIRSAADNLADGVIDDEARVRQYGQLMRQEGLRLTDLVEQILEFAGLQSGQRTMTTRPIEVASLLRDVAATVQATPSGAVAIELAIPEHLPAIAGDEAALRRVFQNLLGNAIKYGAESRWIGLRAEARGPSLDVSVSDRGIGIAAADQARIFDPFYRAPDVVAAQIQGAGLGLSLVKRIVEAHGGRIAVKSAAGEGSTFTVSLPVLAGRIVDGRDGIEQAAPLPL